METLAIKGGKPVRTAPWPRWPISDETEEQAILEVLHSGNWWRHSYGQGVELTEDETNPISTVARFQHEFARYRDCKYGIAAANGTVTLEIALRAGGVCPGDEVIVPPYTFLATASAPLMIGAVPIFVDIHPDTYNLDHRQIEEVISERTKAIIPVHLGGQPCEMDAITEIAQKYNLIVIEDAAHAHGSSYNRRPCGSLGAMASFSFQNSKPITAGEGGIITTNNPEFAEVCESLVWAGRRRGEPWYRHFILASNARITEFQGAILSAQLKRLDAQVRQRMVNGNLLNQLLSNIEGIRPLEILPTTTAHTWHLYIFRYSPDAFHGLPKSIFVQALIAEGIEGVMIGYTNPLYQNPMFLEKKFFGGPYPLVAGIYNKKINYADFAKLCPVSEIACSTEAILITQNILMGNEDDMYDIANGIKKIQANVKQLL
jgi:dTDP-4-amino-4,6-dideoxygalactose transaminase